MELRHLRYFVAVAEELNFRKASERLRVAQPALSSQIQDLEAEIGVRLLDRNTGGVRLTPAGATFLTETRLTLAQSEHATIAARDAAKGRRGRLSIGYLGSLTMEFMPTVLGEFRVRYPDVEVVLVDMAAMSEQLAAFASGELQLAFTPLPDAAIPAQFERTIILRSSGGIAVGKTHPLAKFAAISLEDLAGENLVGMGNRNGESAHRDIINRIFSSVGLQAGPVRLMDGPEALYATVASGLGVSLLADSIGHSQRRDIVMKRIKNKGVKIELEVKAYWPNQATSLLARNFVETIKEHTRLKAKA